MHVRNETRNIGWLEKAQLLSFTGTKTMQLLILTQNSKCGSEADDGGGSAAGGGSCSEADGDACGTAGGGSCSETNGDDGGVVKGARWLPHGFAMATQDTMRPI